MLRFEIHNVIVEHSVGMRENGEKLKYKNNQIKRNRGKTLIKWNPFVKGKKCKYEKMESWRSANAITNVRTYT